MHQQEGLQQRRRQEIEYINGVIRKAAFAAKVAIPPTAFSAALAFGSLVRGSYTEAAFTGVAAGAAYAVFEVCIHGISNSQRRIDWLKAGLRE